MPTYSSLVSATIAPDRPTRSQIAIHVPHTGRVASATVTVDLAHDRPSDLRMWLVTPTRRRVLIRERSRGGYSPRPIEVPAVAGEGLAGRWELWVDDVRAGDGGLVKGWRLDVSTYTAALVIELVFRGGLTDSQKDVFRDATEGLQRLLVGTNGEPLTCRVDAEGVNIDGRGGTLGQAGPTRVRAGDHLPTAGIMSFDSSDLSSMERDGSLPYVLRHELAHVLGFGTLFMLHGLVDENHFVGQAAMREYGHLLGDAPRPVPLEDGGGPGTAGGHWDEEVFGSELLTGYIDAGLNPISRVSAGAFEDLGYDVDYSAADPYVLGLRRLATGPVRHLWHGCNAPEFEVV